MDNTTIWNGHTVYGDAKEIDAVIAADGLISIDESDVASMFTDGGVIYVYTSKGATLNEAIDIILNSIHIKQEDLSKLLIQVWAGKSFKMSDLTPIIELLSNPNSDIELTWGVCMEDNCSNEVKVTILASQKNKNISSKDVGCQHLAAHVAIFASINRHQPGGEIGQTRFVCPGRGRAGSSPARAAK